MLSLLSNPVALLFAAVPLAGLGLIYGWVYFRVCRRREAEWIAARWALIASWLSLLGWTLYVLQAIALSQRGTAILGIITIPLTGIPLAIAVFAVAWGVSVVLLRFFPSRKRERPRGRALVTAWSIVLITTVLCVAHAHSVRLQGIARTEVSAESIGALYGHWWTRHDVRVLSELARNPHTSTEVLLELAAHHDPGVVYGVARNPGTPVAVLERLYADPYNRTGLAVNPSTPVTMLHQLAHDEDQVVLVNLLFNPNVPTDVLEELAKDPRVSKSAVAALERKRDDRKWFILTPPYTWRWSAPFTRVLDDEAPLEQWPKTGYRFETREQCEALRSELLRRESNPRRIEAIKEAGRTGGEYQPLDFYGHSRCSYVTK